ncbi:MAG: hypothetical protein P4L81_03515 [Candidatus Pacebacteria bacterium]|nr:hypothetical protein [Candidatus Paceibacterota bacterium]
MTDPRLSSIDATATTFRVAIMAAGDATVATMTTVTNDEHRRQSNRVLCFDEETRAQVYDLDSEFDPGAIDGVHFLGDAEFTWHCEISDRGS